MASEMETIEQRLKSFIGQLQTECGIFERLVYKHKNQHRRCSYFQYILKVRRDLKLLKLANLEDILDASFLVINGNRPKQKVQLLESLKRRRCGAGKYNFLERLLGVTRLLSQMIEPLLKAAMEISTLLARSFFMKFSLTTLAVLARIRVLVQQMLLDAVLLYNTVSSISQREQTIKLNQEGFEVFREYYPTKEEDSTMLECIWQTDKYVLVERKHKCEANSQEKDIMDDVSLGASKIQYENIEVLLGDTMFKRMLKKSNELRQKVTSIGKPPRGSSTPNGSGTTLAAHCPKLPNTTRSRLGRNYVAKVENLDSRPVHIPQKKPSLESGCVPSKCAKGSSTLGPTSAANTPIPIPNCSQFFSSVLANTDSEVAMQYIQGLCPHGDHEVMEDWDPNELLESWSLDHSKATTKMTMILALARRGFVDPEAANEIELLKRQNARLQSKVEKSEHIIRQLKYDNLEFKARADSYEGKIKTLEAENATLKAEFEKVQMECTKWIDDARADGVQPGFNDFLNSRVGLSLLREVRENTKSIFLRSEEFCAMFVEDAKYYYNYGLDAMEKWVKSKGLTEKFNRAAALENAPNPLNLEFKRKTAASILLSSSPSLPMCYC